MTSLRDWLQPRLLPCTIQTASLIGPRKENQDNYVVIAADPTGKTLAKRLQNGTPYETQRSNWPTRWVRLALLDGMGGHANGREIAEAAATELCLLPRCTTLKHQLKTLLQLHQKLQTQFTGWNYRNPGTTIIWAEIDLQYRNCHLVHVGDSRAWLWNGKQWRQLTHDHTLIEFHFRDGHINAETYDNKKAQPNQRIAQALGYGSWGLTHDILGYDFRAGLRLDTLSTLPANLQDHADIFTFPLTETSVLLLASDGMWNANQMNLPDGYATITHDTAQNIAEAAVAAGSKDNTTVILCTFSPESQS